MPKRSERDGYPHAFEGNPFEGLDAHGVYEELRWGDLPTESWEIEAPEPLAGLGTLASLEFGGVVWKYPDERGPFLAVGTGSNLVYVLPKHKDGGPVPEVPAFDEAAWVCHGEVTRTDYTSVKAGLDAYYYHEHESPYPELWEHPGTGVMVLIPAEHKGKRSYGVVKEGIVG